MIAASLKQIASDLKKAPEVTFRDRMIAASLKPAGATIVRYNSIDLSAIE